MIIVADIAGQFIRCYLIITLTATGLAKLRNWRAATHGLLLEGIFSPTVAPIVIIVVAVVELLLAALLTLDIHPVFTGSAAAGLFIVFGGYQLLSAARRAGSFSCPCAGTVRSEKVTPSAIIGAIFACLLQAALAYIWIVLEIRRGTAAADLFAGTAFAVPFILLFAGILRQARTSKFLPGRPGRQSDGQVSTLPASR